MIGGVDNPLCVEERRENRSGRESGEEEGERGRERGVSETREGNFRSRAKLS